MAQIKGKQLADAPDGITSAKINTDAVTTAKIADANVTTSKLAAGVLSADAAGRAKIASGFFDAATVTDKFAAASIALSKLAEAVIEADGGQAFTANQSMGGFKLTNVGTPTVGTDAANKDYIDNAIAGLAWKDSARCATTANTALTGLLTIDGITLVALDRILVKNQTAPAENGIYTAASGAWTRATDSDTGAEVVSSAVFIEEGTTQSNTMWTMTTDAPIVLGTTALTWVQFAATLSLVAGAGLLDTGGTWSVELATISGLEFDAGGVGGKLQVAVNATGSIQRTATGLEVLKDDITIKENSGGILRSNVPVADNKDQSPAVTAGDNATTALTITRTPAQNVGQGGPEEYVRVSVNGIGYRLGDGIKTKDAYFSGDGGTTARSLDAIVAGDTLFWNGVLSGFNLAASDSVDMEYNAA